MSLNIHKVLNVGISLVWFINGLYCKVLNFVPRHQQIVSRILGNEYAGILTKGIGALEILMGIWILSQIRSRWCALTQILIVATMNIIEFIVVPDLLLFGKFNIFWATLFMVVVCINEFVVGHGLQVIKQK